MVWSLIFKAFLLLAPVPVCWVLNRYLSASSASFSGSILERLHFQTSGPLALYFIVLGITSYMVSPEILQQRAILVDSDWSYNLSLNDPTFDSNNKQGSLRITSGSIGSFQAWSRENNNLFTDKGLLNDQWVYLPLQDVSQLRLVAFGARGNDLDRLHLPVYQLPPEWINETKPRGNPLGKVGTLSLEREWPFLMLVYVVVLPLVVVYLLSRIGLPLVAKITGEDLNIINWSKMPINRIKLELTGAAAAYALVLLVVGYMTHTTGADMSVREAAASKVCMNELQGTWYFELTSNVDKNKTRLDHVGKVNVECSKDNGIIQLVNGVGNRADVQHEANNSCYEYVLSEGGFSWRSLVAKVEGKDMFAIFQTSAGEDTGLLQGKVDSKQMRWDFYDFRETQHHEKALDRGHLILVRPSADTLTPCQDLRQRALSSQK